MSVVEELRQNDPAMKSIRILLHVEPSDAELARALEQNPFVTEINLDLDGEQRADWNSLVHVIATRANLEKVILDDAYSAEQRNARAGLVRAFLHAIRQNTALRSVEMRWLRLPTDISAFVDNASSIASFKLFDCDMEPAEREQGARDLAAALQRNTNIETLKLRSLEDIYAVPILESLRSNTSLKTLIWKENALADETGPALQRLLESTTSIQRFELIALQLRGDTFLPIAHAITRSESVSELKFEDCQFQNQSSLAPLQSILQNKHNLTTLCLQYCNFVGEQVHEDIISVISRPGSLLRCVEFTFTNLQQMFPNIPFEALLQAIEKSKLERFSIGRIETPYQLQTLMQSIPSMRIRELDVAFDRRFLRENANPRQNLLLAIKKNFSLRSVKGKHPNGTDFFDSDDDKQRLALYAIRNKSLDQWFDNPEIVEQRKVWPEALNLAQKAGPNALFRGLHSVLERDYVSLPGGRKRKRPQYYTPA